MFRKIVPKQRAYEMGATWGYARVSTEDQELGLQISALRAAGVPEANIVQEKVSGKAGSERPRYAALLDRLKDGDRLVVWKVDRLGRSTLESLNTAKDLDERGVHIVITTLGIDLKTSAGRLVFGMMVQIAEFERELIRERVKAGMADARSAVSTPAGSTGCVRTSAPRPRDCTTRKGRASYDCGLVRLRPDGCLSCHSGDGVQTRPREPHIPPAAAR